MAPHRAQRHVDLHSVGRHHPARRSRHDSAGKGGQSPNRRNCTGSSTTGTRLTRPDEACPPGRRDAAGWAAVALRPVPHDRREAANPPPDRSSGDRYGGHRSAWRRAARRPRRRAPRPRDRQSAADVFGRIARREPSSPTSGPLSRSCSGRACEIECCTFIGSSPLRQYAEGWGIDQLLKLTEEAIAFAVGEGLPVMYVTEDTTRADPDTLRRLYTTAIRAGAKRICIADTVGHATPAGAAAVVRSSRGWSTNAAGVSGSTGTATAIGTSP